MIRKTNGYIPRGRWPPIAGIRGRRQDKGLAGLELQYEDVLSGKPGETQVVSDPQVRQPLATSR